MRDLASLRARQPAVDLTTISEGALESMLNYVAALQQARRRLVWVQGAWYVYGDGAVCRLHGTSHDGYISTSWYYMDWDTSVAVGLIAGPATTIVAGPFDTEQGALYAAAEWHDKRWRSSHE